MSLGVGQLMALMKPKKHFVGFTWDGFAWDDNGKKGDLAFQAARRDYRGTVVGLEGVTGRKRCQLGRDDGSELKALVRAVARARCQAVSRANGHSCQSRYRLARCLPVLYVAAVAGTLLQAPPLALANDRSLTSVQEVAALSNEPSNAGIPVHLQATVSFYDHRRYSLILNSGAHNLRIPLDWSKGELPVAPGDTVAVEGVTATGAFALCVYGKQVTVIHHGPAPIPEKVSLAEAIEPSRNAQYVESEGRVMLVLAGEHLIDEVDYFTVRLRSQGVTADLSVHASADVSMRSWLGRQMRFRGVSGGLYNSRRQRYQPILYVRSLRDLTLVDGAAAPPVGESSALPLAELFRFGRNMPARVRTSGVVSYVHFNGVFYIQDGNSGIRVRPAHPIDLQWLAGVAHSGPGQPEGF